MVCRKEDVMGVEGAAETLRELEDKGAGVKALREDRELVMGGKEGEGVTMMGRLRHEEEEGIVVVVDLWLVVVGVIGLLLTLLVFTVLR